MPAHLPCPECGTQPVVERGKTIHTRHLVFATCSKGFSCDLYPYTSGHADRAAALASWDRGEAFPDESPATE